MQALRARHSAGPSTRLADPCDVSDTFDLVPDLARLRTQHLYRTRLILEGPQATEAVVGGASYTSFCSNDYLGLANHPEVREALKRGVDDYGVGSGASHLIIGHSRAHHALEEELAHFTGRPRALLFSTGYMANLGVIAALLGRRDLVAQDRLSHASLIDGARLSGARFRRYVHCDVAGLERCLEGESAPRKLAVSDGVFSMDGDIAPVSELAEAAARQGAWLMIDDAHGLGVLGPSGKGTLDHYRCDWKQVPVLMATLGKALGTFGAFVAGEEALIDTLIQGARSYIYTTALPPALAEATRASLKVVQREPWRREWLMQLVQRFRRGAAQLSLPLLPSATPIQPLAVPDSGTALRWAETLRGAGILVQAIRPPTVPRGARLRIAFSAAHTEEHVDRLLDALEGVS